MQEIVIDIEPNGEIKMEGKGFVGAECDQYMQGIEDALGEIQKKELKPEYRQTRPMTRKAGA